ncbi:hypothetical protein [Xanthomonas bonasiae]|uniref:hypothetical protein n=1 Tax=Xanthomonas bonasiae TaxID=2810351 RepID=UPI001786BECD|nr:hypothetical protein [Xanthomonas surreyensis]MBD7923486.1 hypothetical protein [Xanthomonas surreyensis]
MLRFNSYETLLEIDALELGRVAAQLNETGLATDEDGLYLGSMLIEHWSERCTELLREHGYRGGELNVTGHYFSHCGAIYVLYDTELRSLKDANQELRRAASRHDTA